MDTWTLASNPGYLATKTEIWGRNPDLDTGAAPETLWGQGGLYTWQTAAETLEILSSSAADTAAGAGARTVLFSGLDASRNQISETVVLNGTAPVALVNSYLRTFPARVVTVGATGYNAGTITIRRTGAGSVRSMIPTLNGIGLSIATDGVYTVPAGHILICNYGFVNLFSNATNDAITLGIFVRDGVGPGPWVAKEIFESSVAGVSMFPIDMQYRHLKFTENQDIELNAISCVGTNMSAQIRLSGLLLKVNP